MIVLITNLHNINIEPNPNLHTTTIDFIPNLPNMKMYLFINIHLWRLLSIRATCSAPPPPLLLPSLTAVILSGGSASVYVLTLAQPTQLIPTGLGSGFCRRNENENFKKVVKT